MKNNKKCLLRISKMIHFFLLKENLQWITEEYLCLKVDLLLVCAIY